VGYDCLRIDLTAVSPDSLCACSGQTFDYIYPTGPTDSNGCTTFRFNGSILQMENDLATAVDPAVLQVCGCQDRPVRFRSPDVNADCSVDLSDFVIFGQSYAICPPDPSGFQHYTVYSAHCAPCPRPQLADFVIFGQHYNHSCAP